MMNFALVSKLLLLTNYDQNAANSSFKSMQKESAALELNLRLEPTK